MNLHQHTQFVFIKGHYRQLSSEEIVSHSSNAYQLIYLLNGELDLKSHSVNKKLLDHSLCLIPAKSECSLTTTSPCHIYSCEFTAQANQALDLFTLIQTCSVIKAENPDLIEEIFKQLMKTYR